MKVTKSYINSKKSKAPTVVDLFCGAGGLTLGFMQEGFNVIRSIDNDEASVETYETNIGPHIINHFIDEDTELPDADIIIGGPPCQGFSSAGLRRESDARNSLVSCYANLVVKYRPKAFVFENVEGFLTASGGQRVIELLAPLLAAGYHIHIRKINAANYGVPQHRKRVVAIGGLGWDPSFPEPTHYAIGAPGSDLIAGDHLMPTPTIMDAISGLPVPSTNQPGVPNGHYYRPLEGMDLERASALRQGQTMRDLPMNLWHESFKRRAFRRVADGTPTERRGGPPSGVKRLCADHPSKTITTGAVSEFLHPLENRNLTLRECARIQTFPDSFEFRGNAADQILQIGNAVPPNLARAIARSLFSDLANATPTQSEGKLLSFVPTQSSGMSPALKQTIERVNETVAAHGAKPLPLPLAVCR